MSRIRIELNSQGIREYLRSPSVQEALKAQAQDIATACGEGYKADSVRGRRRALANVKATTKEAGLDNSKNATILKNARRKR